MIPDFRPLNPWGRPMPKPSRGIASVPAKDALWQVHVEQNATGKMIPVGPRMVEQAAGRFIEAINKMIASGKERDWSNPTLVKVHHL